MLTERVALQFCGFGGQGIVLSSVIIGTAAVRGRGLHAVQTQSYGSEARGGECQAELILSPGPIGSPLADQVDILVAMSQVALDRYLSRLRPGGILILVSDTVQRPDREDATILEIPALRMAQEIGAAIAANMVVLGCLTELSALISHADLVDAIRSVVPEPTIDLNLKAAESGREWAAQTLDSGGK